MSLLDLLDHVDHELANEVKDFEVVILELHLHIETCEFAEMAICVGVLCAEYWSDLKDSLEVSTKSHLLVELRTLCKASVLLEVLELEHIRTAFRSTSDKFRCVDFNKVIVEHKLAVNLTNA